MNPPSHIQVEETFVKVAQDLTMLFVESVPYPDGYQEIENWHRATISFDGVVNGVLAIAVPDSLQIEMAMNLMGLDADDPTINRFTDDTLREFVNVLCGNLLTEWVGDEPVMNLGQPQVESLLRYSPGSSARGKEFPFDVEGLPVFLSLEIHPTANKGG